MRRLAAALLLGALGCEGAGQARAEAAEARLERARVALAASFVGGRGGGLRGLLHQDLIVQPPVPDRALGGTMAADYLERLAQATDVRGSRLLPSAITEEGDFLLEQGTWVLEAGRPLRSRYTIRWRESPAGWRVVLWRWTLFR